MDPYKHSIDRMISTIKHHAADSASYTGIPEFSDAVMQAMREVPRQDFVPESYKKYAHEDSPLSIGWGQTISQPFIVALMVEVLRLKKTDNVLEIGTGCGYSAAILSKLCKQVYTVEIVPELAMMATRNLAGYVNVEVSNRNGYNGWQSRAPFDAITIAAAPEKIPDPLLRQLAKGGRMIVPVENRGFGQSLTLIEKDEQGKMSFREILPVIFVPFVRE